MIKYNDVSCNYKKINLQNITIWKKRFCWSI